MEGRRGTGFERLLNVATAALLLLAGGVLARNHLAPAWRARQVVEVGEPVPASLELVSLTGADTLALGDLRPALLLYYQSTCPACTRNLPGWRRLLDELPADLTAVAIGLEGARPARRYAREELPGAAAVRPADRARATHRMGVEAVPTTQLVGPDGRLRWSRSGVLSAADVDGILARIRESDRFGTQPTRRSPHPSPSGRAP